MPKVVKVDFTTARAGYAYNANRERTDHIEKYTIQGVDEKVYLALQTAGINIADVKTIQIEFTGDFDKIEDAIDKKLLISVELRRVEVKLQWVDGSRNAGYKALKLIANGFTVVDKK
ncbi:hypothetical protein RU86_GL002287 [Lactococcus piscium]|uniref:Uncharacterized protein n=1 Tax=Pseudolactococcus piscium TaxID=1364 RepID=A0A2A5S053_9LACT|nr:hypothetical protein RU86_GL002287 [Lactococcus piscium]